MKVLLFGGNGQVGRAVAERLAQDVDLRALDRSTADFSEPDQLAEMVRELRPDAVINAAAFTNVDKAEAEPELARAVNATAPGRIATATADIGALLIHYSTDYVFDGRKDRPYVEDDVTNPLSVYGATKLEGERLVASAQGPHLVFRTSWVHSATGANFASKILTRASEQDRLTVVDDQFGAPTSAALIADVTYEALSRHAEGRPLPSGLYHLVASGSTTWYHYAQEVLKQALRAGIALKATADDIAPVSALTFATSARRPANSRLSTARLTGALGHGLADWRDDLGPTLDALIKRSL